MTSRHPAVSCACPKCQSERRTTPPPATEEREAAFNAAIIGLNWDKNPALVANARQLFGNSLNNSCGALSDYMAGRFIDAFRAAAAALSALAPIRAQEIAAARAEEQGYRHTQVAALKQVHAAEILAAEAMGMGRARTVVQNTRDGMKFDPSATREWRNAITGGFNAADLALRHELDAIERGEHGAGK